MAVLTQEKVVKRSAELQRAGKKVVFTNGCFDIIHRGHIELLMQAKSEGDYLLVAINSDDSIRRLKGNSRPIQPAEDRAIILDAISSVDDVVIFFEDTPEWLISIVKPNILVKGADYCEDEIIGADLIRSWGGHVIRVPHLKNRGTQNILDKIKTSSGSEIA